MVIEEAKVAGPKLRKKHLHFDNFFTAGLKRAHETMEIVLEALKLPRSKTLVIQSNALNERNYGELQGWTKQRLLHVIRRNKCMNGDADLHRGRLEVKVLRIRIVVLSNTTKVD